MNRVGSSRYAHNEGHTDICFSDDGEYIITCGSDGDVRMFKGIDQDVISEICVGEEAFAVVQKDGKLYVGSDHNNVQALTFPKGEVDGILTHFTAPVNTLDVCKDGTLVAAGSSDCEIHVIDVTTSVVTYFSGHKAPILKVSLDPKKEYLASSSCDGTVRVWKIEDQKMMKEWVDVVKTCNSFHNSKSLCSIRWESSTGRLLAIPFPKEVRLVQRSTWNVMVTLTSPTSEDFSLTAWSSCGKFLAATTVHGHISVWNTLVNKQVSSYNDENKLNICALKWHPDTDRRQIAYCDEKGQLLMLENCFPVATTSNPSHQLKSTAQEMNAENLYDDDEDEPGSISLEKIKADFSFLDGGVDRSPKGDNDDDDDDDASSIKSSSSNYGGKPTLAVDLQPTFQPTSAPAHLQRRFMVFNDIGYVRQINTDEENMIDIDFHDASVHHSFRINNLLNHTLAALNSEALILACEKNDDSTSKLFCRMLKSWDSTKEWSVEMQSNENIDGIAVGLKWIAVVTSSRLLRLFTLSGVQREIICLPGPLVCLNASDDLLILVYHSSIGLPGEQNLCFAVYQITHDVRVLVAAQPLPLTPKSSLKWVGFSDQLNPCIMDSDGVLKLFSSNSGLWKPICFTDAQAKDLSDHYFMIGVSEERQNIRCILCKGSYYPSTTPHPFITEIPWQIPVCGLSMDKGIFEEKLWRCSISKECLPKEDKKLNTEFKTTALKLFALACGTSHEMRVFELCDITNQTDVTELALKYASKIGNELLVQKLTDLLNEQRTRSEISNDVSELNERFNRYDRSKSSQGENGEARYTNDDYQSQELFPSKDSMSQETDICSSESTTSTHSLIAEIKKRKENINAQRSMLPSRRINPFRKLPVIEVTPSSSSSESHTQCSNSASQSINYKDENLDRTFMQWFSLEKDNLTQEFPGLDESDFRKEAISKFKTLKANRMNATNEVMSNGTPLIEERTNGDSTTDDQNYNGASKKRKSIGDPITSTSNHNEAGIPKKKPLLKLQNFIYTKKS